MTVFNKKDKKDKTKKTKEQENSNNSFEIEPVKCDQLLNNRYLVCRELDVGVFSNVWLCGDEQEKKFVAIKVLKNTSAGDIIRGQDEIDLLKCASDNSDPRREKVVRLLDHFQLSGENNVIHICMVFEILGDSLYSLIVRSEYRGIPVPNIKSIVKQILQSLDYLHTKCKIIHTDIKPDNILMMSDEDHIRKLMNQPSSVSGNKKKPDPAKEICDVKIKIADLGNACWVDHHFTNHIQARQYRSPEVILGADYGPSADIWSVACVVYELATGDFLFNPLAHCSYLRDLNHLAQMIKLLGNIPKHVAFSGEYSRELFTHDGELRHILIGKSLSLCEIMIEMYKWDENEAHQFVDFLLPMLTFDPNNRASAQECINHPWLQSK